MPRGQRPQILQSRRGDNLDVIPPLLTGTLGIPPKGDLCPPQHVGGPHLWEPLNTCSTASCTGAHSASHCHSAEQTHSVEAKSGHVRLTIWPLPGTSGAEMGAGFLPHSFLIFFPLLLPVSVLLHSDPNNTCQLTNCTLHITNLGRDFHMASPINTPL